MLASEITKPGVYWCRVLGSDLWRLVLIRRSWKGSRFTVYDCEKPTEDSSRWPLSSAMYKHFEFEPAKNPDEIAAMKDRCFGIVTGDPIRAGQTVYITKPTGGK